MRIILGIVDRELHTPFTRARHDIKHGLKDLTRIYTTYIFQISILCFDTKRIMNITIERKFYKCTIMRPPTSSVVSRSLLLTHHSITHPVISTWHTNCGHYYGMYNKNKYNWSQKSKVSQVNLHNRYCKKQKYVGVIESKALSTRIRIFLRTEVFFSVFEKNSRPHVAYSNRFRLSPRKRKNGGNMIAPAVKHAHCLVIWDRPIAITYAYTHINYVNLAPFIKKFSLLCVTAFRALYSRIASYLLYSPWTFNIVTCSWIHAIVLKISSSKIAIYTFGLQSWKTHKTTDKTRVAIDWTRLSRHRFRKPPFSPVHTKTSTLESVFENLHFRMPKTPFTCGRNAKTEKKTSVFKNIRMRVDGA